MPLVMNETPLDSIHPDPGNPRTHPKRQIEQLAACIEAFGFTNPILIDDENCIIAGHGRLAAARKLRLKSVPTITVLGLTPTARRALRLADNRIAENAAWEPDLLRIELAAISLDVSFNLEITGFSTSEIDVSLALPPEERLDVIPRRRPKPRTRVGDIWQLGYHRVGCGDARDRAFVERVMDGALADAAILDPPYNLSIGRHANVRSNHPEFPMASGEMTEGEYQAFLAACIDNAYPFSLDGSVHFCFIDWRHLSTLMAAAGDRYCELLNLCVWNKSNAGMGSLYRSKHELVLVYKAGRAKPLNTIQLGRDGRHRTNVWDYSSVTSPQGSRRQDLALHPTPKPVALIEDAIKDVTPRGGVVLDLFLGSGTTLIAAERAGRVVRAVELDPTYVDVAVDRWTELTAGKPRRISREDAS
jgi:DNA modification methylase